MPTTVGNANTVARWCGTSTRYAECRCAFPSGWIIAYTDCTTAAGRPNHDLRGAGAEGSPAGAQGPPRIHAAALAARRLNHLLECQAGAVSIAHRLAGWSLFQPALQSVVA